MAARWIKLTMTIAMAFTLASCASKKKAAEGEGDGIAATEEGVNPDAGITTKEMTFDAVGSDSGTIKGLHTINFDYDQATLSSQSRRLLAENAEWIKRNRDVILQIEGHCDSRGTVEYNLALGERRAKSVKNYLTTLGVESKRLSIISYGKEKPIATGDSEDSFYRNRRANFVPLPK